MKLLTFLYKGQPTVGIAVNQQVIPLKDVAPELPRTLKEIIAHVPLAQLEAIAKSATMFLPIETIEFLPPIPNPDKILCVGLNYMAHAAESAYKEPPTLPTIFTRFASTLVPHKGELSAPSCSTKFDYEGELAVIIGKTARNVKKADALSYVFGYSIFHDATVRDYQRRTTQWTLGKNFDGSGGFGPVIVTADLLPAGGKGLKLETRLNGEVMQSASTADMIFDVATLIEHLSEVLTLSAGDVIITGTPDGVGFARTPPRYLNDGDKVAITIEGIGTLENHVNGKNTRA